MTFHYCNGVELSLVSEYMIKFLGADGTFFLYSIINFLGFIFIYFVVKETNGLTDK